MSADTRTDDELRAVIDAGKAAEKELSDRRYLYALHIEDRVRRVLRADGSGAFGADELHFAATVRCECGAGMAYPRNIGIHGAWHCSAILRGLAARGSSHSAALPFAYYDIKSEDQPSANCATTRDPQTPGVLS